MDARQNKEIKMSQTPITELPHNTWVKVWNPEYPQADYRLINGWREPSSKEPVIVYTLLVEDLPGIYLAYAGAQGLEEEDMINLLNKHYMTLEGNTNADTRKSN